MHRPPLPSLLRPPRNACRKSCPGIRRLWWLRHRPQSRRPAPNSSLRTSMRCSIDLTGLGPTRRGLRTLGRRRSGTPQKCWDTLSPWPPRSRSFQVRRTRWGQPPPGWGSRGPLPTVGCCQCCCCGPVKKIKNDLLYQHTNGQNVVAWYHNGGVEELSLIRAQLFSIWAPIQAPPFKQ